MTNSLVATALYTINYNAVSMPTFNPAAGSYSTAQTISMTTTTTGATIYYTTDGTTPTTSSTLYLGYEPTDDHVYQRNPCNR